MKPILSQQKVITRKILAPTDRFTITTYKRQLKPSPPIGPMVGQRGINIMNFIQDVKQATSHFAENIELRIRVLVYPGRKYSFYAVKANKQALIKKVKNSLLSEKLKRFLIQKLNSIDV